MSIKIGRNDLCWCGSQKKYKHCHEDFDKKICFAQAMGYEVPTRKLVKTPRQIEQIRASGRMNTTILDAIAENLCPGMTTGDIDRMVHHKTIELGGIPAQLGYNGFPKSVCTSVNNQVCHGIPSDDVILQEGDIVNIDVSTVYNGYYSDSSRMFCIGTTAEDSRVLIRVVEECVRLGLYQVKPWQLIGNVGYAVNQHARRNGYSVVKDIGGHGIGLAFHEDPWVSFVSKAGTGMIMVPGMIFTIEPMINIGSDKVVLDQENGWTVYTSDGSLSAQREVMVLVTELGHEILAH